MLRSKLIKAKLQQSARSRPPGMAGNVFSGPIDRISLTISERITIANQMICDGFTPKQASLHSGIDILTVYMNLTGRAFDSLVVFPQPKIKDPIEYETALAAARMFYTEEWRSLRCSAIVTGVDPADLLASFSSECIRTMKLTNEEADNVFCLHQSGIINKEIAAIYNVDVENVIKYTKSIADQKNKKQAARLRATGKHTANAMDNGKQFFVKNKDEYVCTSYSYRTIAEAAGISTKELLCKLDGSSDYNIK